MINWTLIFNLQQNNLCYVVKCKMPILIISDLQRKCNLYAKNFPKYLVSSQKSSTFAAVFAPTASEQKNRAKMMKNRNAENQPLTKKMQRKLKKVA